MIAMAGYKPETHKVFTEDGYVLTVYRYKLLGFDLPKSTLRAE